MKYLSDEFEFPGESVVDDPLPLGTMYQNVSTAYLNGFVNYANPVKAFVLERYVAWKASVEGHKVNIQEPPGSLKWVDYEPKTKQDLYDKLIENGRVYHSKLDYAFQDDVLLLSRTSYEGTWLFFWFDRDCSDSCIGRFKTDDSKEEVIAEFVRYVQERQADLGKSYLSKDDSVAKEIPLHYFKGWIG